MQRRHQGGAPRARCWHASGWRPPADARSTHARNACLHLHLALARSALWSPRSFPLSEFCRGGSSKQQVAGGVRVRKSGCSCQVLDTSGVVRKQAEGGVGGAGGGQKAGLCASSRPWCERLRWMSESQQVRDEVDSLRRILRERKTEVAARDALGKANQYQDVATLGNPAPGDQPSGHAGCRARLPGRACGLGTRMALSPPPRLLSSADLACAQCGGRRS